MCQRSSRRLLVVTRFSPLGQTGTSTYLFSILTHLHRNGVETTLCWSERPEAAWRRGWWVVPKEIANVATLWMPGALCLGRLRVFPSFFVDPVRKGVRRIAKGLLMALGLRKLRPPATPAASEPTEVSPSEDFAPFQWDRPPDGYEHEFFGSAVARVRPDVVLFNYCWMTPILDRLPARRFLSVTMTHDLRHLYSTLVEGAIRQTEGEIMSREVEIGYLQRSDVVVAIREDDARRFRELMPGRDVILATPSLLPQPGAGEPVPGRCLFVAADNLANREGIEWFLREAWPHVRAAHPAAELHLCGTICRTLPPGDPPGVIRRGFVESLREAYTEAAVVIVPLLRGSGVKIKLMEALAHGKACVATPIGTEGVPALEECVCVAGTPEEFASHVARLLSEAPARNAMETRAFETVREHFSAETCYAALLERIQSAARS